MDIYDEVRYGNSLTRTETLNTPGAFGQAMLSGFYECSAAQNNPTQFPTGATSWWHLNVTRHSNINNNYAMQIAGSFFDQALWYRKTNNSGTTSWTKVKGGDDFYASRANLLMSGGGTITHSTAGELKWTERIIVLGGGRGSVTGIGAQAGYYDINMPPLGTVVAGMGSTPPQTVTAGGILILPWTALYYKLTTATNTPTINSNFLLVHYGANAIVTDDMVLLAVNNSDSSNSSHTFVKLGTGQVLFKNNQTFRGGTPVSITNYATSALAIADAALPIGANYTVNVNGAKQLYIK